MEPRATRKQRALMDVLRNLKNRETFTPTKQGKIRQQWIDKIRKQDITKLLAKDYVGSTAKSYDWAAGPCS